MIKDTFHTMNRHPPSNHGDEPPAYLDETSSFLSDVESSSAVSRNGPTMRLLPTTGNESNLSSSSAPSSYQPSSYQPSSYQPDHDETTPYVHPFQKQPYSPDTFHSLSLQHKPHAPRQFWLLLSGGTFGRRARNGHERSTTGRDRARMAVTQGRP